MKRLFILALSICFLTVTSYSETFAVWDPAKAEQERAVALDRGALEFEFSCREDSVTSAGESHEKRWLKGEIPLLLEGGHVLVKFQCKGNLMDHAEDIYDTIENIVGQGTLHGTQREYDLYGPSKVIECRMDNGRFTASVRIKGKQWSKLDEKTGCGYPTVSLSYELVHNNDLRGTRICRNLAGGVIVISTEHVQENPAEKTGAATFYNTGLSEISETIEFPWREGATFEIGKPSECSAKFTYHWPKAPRRDYGDHFKPLLRFENPPDPTKFPQGRFGPPLSKVPYGYPPNTPIIDPGSP